MGASYNERYFVLVLWMRGNVWCSHCWIWHTSAFFNTFASQQHIMTFTKKSKNFRSRSCKSDFKSFFATQFETTCLGWSVILNKARLLFFCTINQVAKHLSSKKLAALKSNAVVGIALRGGRELLKLIFTWRYSSIWTQNSCSESRKYILHGAKDRLPRNSIGCIGVEPDPCV